MVNLFLLFIGWCFLLLICWPVALLALVLLPVIWLVSIPIRLVMAIVHGLLALVKAILLLPARLLGYRSQS
jgi:hypothetical protein